MENIKSKFFVRLMPSDKIDWENIKIETNEMIIHVRCLQDFRFKDVNTKPRYWSFQTDGVFHNACQQKVYETVMEGVIQSVYKGVNTVIMAYGQTCSGKSYTMAALQNQYECRGIVPRFISAIFDDCKVKTTEWKVNVGVSFVEICRYGIYDLMAPDPKKLCKVNKVSVVNVTTKEELLALIFKGEAHRECAEFAPYLGAHCANAFITLHFECLSLIQSHAVRIKSKVHFGDLAGIETVGKERFTSFKPAKWQGQANLSKSELEMVLMYMSKLDDFQNDSRFKSCKIIEYLGSSFSANSILRFIGHIRPTHCDLDVTLSTLKFGLTVKHLPIAPLAHYIEPNTERMLENIKEELDGLKDEILVNKLLSGESDFMLENFSQARIAHLERLALAYLHGWSSEVNVLGSAEKNIVLKTFKYLFAKEKQEYENNLRELRSSSNYSGSETNKRISKTSSASIKLKDKQDSTLKKRYNFKEKRKMSSKLLNTTPQKSGVYLSTTVQPEVKLETETKPEIPNYTSSIDSVFITEINEKKLWDEFLQDNCMPPQYLENLADSANTKKINYEVAANDYRNTKKDVERNKLLLKELAWKRQNAKSELYNKFGQVLTTQTERATAKLVYKLENIEMALKKLLEKLYIEWKDAANDYLQQKSNIDVAFLDYCNNRSHVNVTNVNGKYDFYLLREQEVTTCEKETYKQECNNKIRYMTLQKKLIDQYTKKYRVAS